MKLLRWGTVVRESSEYIKRIQRTSSYFQTSYEDKTKSECEKTMDLLNLFG